MHFSKSALYAAAGIALASPSLCLHIPRSFTLALTGANAEPIYDVIPAHNETDSDLPPIHVPICGRSAGPGDWNLISCARLLVNLKNLPEYTREEIWSKFKAGFSHLPTTFSITDPVTEKTCYLTFDLFQAAAQVTASERFSLQDEQPDLNRIYYDCLKKGLYGMERIGMTGNVVVLLGPRFSDPASEDMFGGAFGNDTASSSGSVTDLTHYEYMRTARLPTL